MPIYDYQCEPKGHRFELRQGIHESPVQACPECGGPVRRIIHPVGIVFKGSGFYATDSRGTSKSAESKTDTSTDSKTDASAESKSGTSTESKTEPAGETKAKPSESKPDSSGA